MPNFTYTDNIPSAPHNPSVDQPDMQINTNSTDGIIAVDHVSFNDNDGGYHKKVSLINKTAPFPTPSGVGSVLYSTINEWVFTNASLAGAGIQMTVSGQPPINLQNGGSFLPGAMIIKWGIVNGTHGAGFLNAGDSGTVNFTPAFPNACFNVFTNPAFTTGTIPSSSSGLTVAINKTLSKAAFNWLINTNSGSYTNFYWFAIGN